MFRTELTPHKSPAPVHLQHALLTIGSCFSETIGNRLTENKFNCRANPFGVIYNPHSIHQALRYAVNNQLPPDHTFFSNHDIHLNYEFHSSFGSLSSSAMRTRLAETIGSIHQFLKKADWLMVTYGTAWIYIRKDTGDIVANCHKMPPVHFQKELFTQKKLIDSFEGFYKELKIFNPGVHIILTVSPVRHVKDSLELNSVSKSVLRLACHTLSELHNDVFYFPAYELLLDDLRDYRFYQPDMLHPSAEAEEYIWQKFSETFFDDAARSFLREWKPILQALRHKPFHPASKAHRHFVQQTIRKLETLKAMVNVEAELAQLKDQLQ